MSEGYFVIRTYKAGEIGEKTKFFVPGKRSEKTLSKRQRAAIHKQEQNEYSAQKALARLINANFQAGDLFLGLDYNDAGLARVKAWARKQGLPIDSQEEGERNDALWEAAAHELDIALRRVKRRLEKQGMELKAIYCTSDMDGDTGEIVRVHHHLIVNAGVQEAFLTAWEKYGLGGVSWSALWDNQLDRTPIAEYIIKQVRRIPDAKKFRSTRNLVRPKPKDRIAYTDTELQVPRGGKLIYRQKYENKQTSSRSYQNRQPQYIRYILPKKNEIPPDSAETA
ncbi:MAG: hypothetical protein ACI3V4_02535 [Faecousia sp.]